MLGWTMAVQPRHIKIGLAGRAREWGYLTYEASELRNAFNRVARTVPSYRNQEMAAMVAAPWCSRIAKAASPATTSAMAIR